MRLVKLKLRGSCPFWMMPPIRLHERQDTSPLVNIDKLSDAQKDIINKSVRAQEIMLFDPEGIRVFGSLNDVGIAMDTYVSVEDVPEEDIIPEMVSVTVDDPVVEDEEDDGWTIKPEYYEEAKILLKKNGNTIKKAVFALDKTDEHLMLLHACLQTEDNDKKRDGVINAIQAKISEY